ncbi:Hypoxia up-regulated protein 1 [Rhizoctonia solani]|uniref:Hypoxia up-regulated protein 1 n=1 Tax=Rhizoctonia solani TaxID=456999 RepID=A0A0K6FZ75_9AGAM|nr:Hypoxia up-regulated protein 1 [Rhizoctonia solani]
MVIDAIEVAGMKLVTLVNDGTAVALPPAPPSPPFTQPPFDTLASGTKLTRQIQSVLDAKVATNVRCDLIGRPYAKLAREAERVKTISSADAYFSAGVEGLVDDRDFKTKLERKSFDEATEGLFWRFQQDAMDGTVVLADVESAMLHGGNTRVPFVQAVVKNAVGSAKLATNVNADEACVLDTAFYGAPLCRQLRTRSITVQDGNRRTIKTIPLPIRPPTGIRKTSTLKHKQHFDVVIGFKDQPSANFPTLQYTTVGAKTAYHNLTERGATDGAVKLTVLYSESEIESLFGGEFFRTLDTDSSTVSASEGTKVEGELKKPVEKLQSSEITPSLEPVITKPMFLEEKKADCKRRQGRQ